MHGASWLGLGVWRFLRGLCLLDRLLAYRPRFTLHDPLPAAQSTIHMSVVDHTLLTTMVVVYLSWIG